METHPLVTQLLHLFAQHQDAVIADQQSAYMKHRFSFYGIQSTLRRTLQREVFMQHPLLSADELMDCLEQLWCEEKRELHYAALDLAEKYKQFWSEKSGEMFATFAIMTISNSWWDTVDVLASKLIGMLVYHNAHLLENLDQWHTSANMWQRRVAIIYQLKYKHKTDKPRLIRAIKTTMHEDEFFIRKAIGWALREYSKTDPEFVKDFTKEHKSNLSSLSMREATRLL